MTKNKKETSVGRNLSYSSASVVYKSKSGFWRGFALPYDVTYEANSREKVLDVLRNMVNSYEENLKKYGHPYHLSAVPLSDEEDLEKYNQISMDLMNNLLAGRDKINSPDYYAEAKLPC